MLQGGLTKDMKCLSSALALAFALLFALPVPAGAFGASGGCGEGKCIECHSLDEKEAEGLLKGLVEKIHKVEFSQVPGLWKVEVEGKGQRGVVYIDFSKAFTLTGRIIRLADWTEVVEGVSAKPRKADPATVPLADALLLGSREAATKVIVFTDPQCPYCKKLHEELGKVVAENPDVAFYMKLFPLASHPESYGISKAVICEKSLSLLEESFAGKKIPEPSCETDAVDRNIELAGQMGITSTPTLLLPDGRILPGFKPAEKLLEILTAPPEGTAP
jgi:thiol:disulfide interchange protein DsbC